MYLLLIWTIGVTSARPFLTLAAALVNIALTNNGGSASEFLLMSLSFCASLNRCEMCLEPQALAHDGCGIETSHLKIDAFAGYAADYSIKTLGEESP